MNSSFFPPINNYSVTRNSAMSFRDIPGFGFYPTDEQLFGYLKKKVLGEDIPECILPDIDLYLFKPSDLPLYIERSLIGNPDQDKWYFFCPRNSNNRKVLDVGKWKKTGNEIVIVSADTGEVLGTKSIFVFHRYRGSSENGSWVVHEYTLDSSYLGYNVDQMPFVAYCLKMK